MKTHHVGTHLKTINCWSSQAPKEPVYCSSCRLVFFRSPVGPQLKKSPVGQIYSNMEVESVGQRRTSMKLQCLLVHKSCVSFDFIISLSYTLCFDFVIYSKVTFSRRFVQSSFSLQFRVNPFQECR